MASPIRASLWREAFRSFSQHRQEWLKCALWFFLIMLPGSYVILWQMGYGMGNPAMLDFIIDHLKHAHDPDYFKAHPDNFAAVMKNLPKPPLFLQFAVFFAQIIVWIQVYVFYGLFMKYEGVVSNLKLDWKGFFYFLWKLFLWWLLIMLWMVAGMIIIGLVAAIAIFLIRLLFVSPDVRMILASLTMIGAGLSAMIGMIYLMMRYVLIFSLAAAWVKAPIKMSARLMSGNTWRFFWNMLWLYIIFLPLVLLLVLLLLGSGQVMNGNIPVGIILAIGYTALLLFIGGFFASFHATVCRIFYQEKRQSDPSFVLESRT